MQTGEPSFRLNAYNALSIGEEVTVSGIAQYLGISDKTVYARMRKMNGEFTLEKEGSFIMQQLRYLL